MKKQSCELYPFLQATAGNWRNAAYVVCKNCPHGRSPLCTGFLLTIGADSTPIVFPADRFYQQTGEYPDRTECAVVFSRAAFESIYAQWLKWQIDSPDACALLQLTT